jgi:hypothetical protein
MQDAVREPFPEAVARAFDVQARVCRGLGSPLYADLCEALRDALPRSRALRVLAAGFPEDPLRGLLALRLLGGVHALVLAGEAPELARHYPSAGGRPEGPAAGRALIELIELEHARLEPWLASVPQTNEVRRSAALLGGFLEVSARTRLPLALREIGASAGLNLLFDRFHYALGPHRWGDPSSPVRIEVEWQGSGAPPFATPLAVESRRGCDLAPIPLADPQAQRRLEAYVWPDQPGRLSNLRAAIALAREAGVDVEASGAAAWLARELVPTGENVTSVVFHSVMWSYVAAEEREAIRRVIEAAGARASERAPLAWLQLEDGMPRTALRLRLWPFAPEERILAESHPHATWIRWSDAAGPRPPEPRT